MRAAYCDAPGRMVVREVDAPVLQAGDALVRVAACGICGSDLHWYGGRGVPPTICPGHEAVGEVAAVASGSDWREGDRVAIEPLRPCGCCQRCLRDEYHLCPRLHILGVMENGALADLVAVPERSLVRLPDDLDFDVAVLAEPLAVSVHAARIAGVSAGQRVLVLGSGAIGLLSIVAARAAGATEVWATARYPQQAAAARAMGAARVFGTEKEDRRQLREAAQEDPVDVVMETVGGVAPTVRQAASVVTAGGNVVVLGMFNEPPEFPALQVLFKEISVIGSMVYNRAGGIRDFDRTVEILLDERARLASLVTHRFPLDDCDRAFAAAADKTSGSVKVVIEPA